jgi:hypothetical protein
MTKLEAIREAAMAKQRLIVGDKKRNYMEVRMVNEGVTFYIKHTHPLDAKGYY